MNTLLKIFSLALVIGITSCASDPAPIPKPVPTEQKPPVKVPKFEQSAAYELIEKQLAFGPRVPGTTAHKAARDWMIEELEKTGATLYPQDFSAKHFDGRTFQGTNIIASFNPDHPKRVLIAAHWDSRELANKDEDPKLAKEPVPGADDGASGVAILMQIAKHIQANPIDMGVDIMMIDLEDQGDSEGEGYETWCLGSQHWSKNPHKPGYTAKFGILLDMVGAKDARFTKEEVSRTYANKYVNKLWNIAQKMGYGQYFVSEETRAVVDDHLFINQIAKIPMLDIINRPVGSETGFGDYWHTHNDDIDVIDKRTLKAVGQTVLAVLYNESTGRF